MQPPPWVALSLASFLGRFFGVYSSLLYLMRPRFHLRFLFLLLGISVTMAQSPYSFTNFQEPSANAETAVEFKSHGSSTSVPFTLSVHFERVRSVPLVDGTLDGASGKFGVDTGARLSLLLHGPFVNQNDLRTKYHPQVSGVTGWGLGGPIRSQIDRGKLLTMGKLQVRNPLVRLPLQKSGGLTISDTAGLIGADILRQFNIPLDYGATVHYVREKPSVRKTHEL